MKAITELGFNLDNCAYVHIGDEAHLVSHRGDKLFVDAALYHPADGTPYRFASAVVLEPRSFSIRTKTDTSNTLILSVGFAYNEKNNVTADIGTWPRDREPEIEAWLTKTNQLIGNTSQPSPAPV